METSVYILFTYMVCSMFTQQSTRCMSDLKVPLVAGFAIEFLGTVSSTLLAKATSTRHIPAMHFARCIADAAVVLAGKGTSTLSAETTCCVVIHTSILKNCCIGVTCKLVLFITQCIIYQHHDLVTIF